MDTVDAGQHADIRPDGSIEPIGGVGASALHLLLCLRGRCLVGTVSAPSALVQIGGL
jgi:hypothetical protein